METRTTFKDFLTDQSQKPISHNCTVVKLLSFCDLSISANVDALYVQITEALRLLVRISPYILLNLESPLKGSPLINHDDFMRLGMVTNSVQTRDYCSQQNITGFSTGNSISNLWGQ